MALNLTDEQKNEFTRYHSIPSLDQYFYAVKNTEGESPRKTVKNIVGSGFSIIDTIELVDPKWVDSNNATGKTYWSIVECTRSELDSSVDSSQAELISHLLNWGNAISTTTKRLVSDDSAVEMSLEGSVESYIKSAEELDSEVPLWEWSIFSFTEEDSLNSNLVQSFLNDSEIAPRMNLNEWLSPFVDSAGQYWDSNVHWTSGEDSGYGRWIGNSTVPDSA